MYDYEASASKKPSGGFEVEKDMENNFWEEFDRRSKKANKDTKIFLLMVFGSPIVFILLFLLPFIIIPILLIVGGFVLYRFIKKHKTK